MLEKFLRETELFTHGSKDLRELRARRPSGTPYKRNKDGSHSMNIERPYFDISKIAEFYLDLQGAVPKSESSIADSRVLREGTASIHHDLVSGGSAQVGVLHAREVLDEEHYVQRGYVRILFRTKEKGPIHEGYVLCDLVKATSGLKRQEYEIEPTAPDAPRDLMAKQGYLKRREVTVVPLGLERYAGRRMRL